VERINLYLDKDSLDFLKSLKSPVSEHIRHAIALYIHNLRQEQAKLKASASVSAKGGV